MSKLTVLFLACFVGSLNAARLQVSGRDLIYNGQKVFLSGANIAWKSYGYDFGNGQYEGGSKSTLEAWLTQIANAGGNSVRIWLHVEGQNTPKFDSNGFVTGLDNTGSMINDMRSFLDFARSKNLLVVFALWNGAYIENQNFLNLMWDEAKLQSYIDNALKPMATALAGHPALAAWEIMNEPEGSVLNNQDDPNSCFSTKVLANTGAGWTGKSIPMQNLLKFVNWQAHAIKQVDSGALISVGSWSEHAQTNAFPESRDYYTDECLIAAGNRNLGKIDFYQMHTYNGAKNPTGSWNPNAPFTKQASAYQLSKPLVIGEFASVCAQSTSEETMFNYAYNNGYQGAWSWHYNAGGECSDTQAAQDSGIQQLKGKTNPLVVNFPVGY